MNPNDSSLAFLFRLLLLVPALLLCSCAGLGGSYGTMVRSTEVDALFSRAELLPAHTYYWAGPEDAPDAIIAISDQVRFQSRFWHRATDPATQLVAWRQMLGTREAPGPGAVHEYYGTRILDPEGRQIGVWYGYVDYSPVKRIDNGVYTIYAPTPSNMAVTRNRNRPLRW